MTEKFNKKCYTYTMNNYDIML